MSKALQLTITNLVQNIANNPDSETLAASCKAITDYIGQFFPGLTLLTLEGPISRTQRGFYLLGPGTYDDGAIVVPDGSIAIVRTDEDPYIVTYIQVVRPAHIPVIEDTEAWVEEDGRQAGDIALYDEDGTLTLVVADGNGSYAYVALTAAV